MPIKAKICGLRLPEHALLAARLGASMLGFVHFPPSPRHLSATEAAALAAAVRAEYPSLPLVAVMVDPSDAELEAILSAYAPDYVQLHGKETPARLAAIRARWNTKLIKAISVSTAADLAQAQDFTPLADMLMFDAKAPKDAALPGGNGLAFDWSLLRAATLPGGIPWMLSGGLTPENLAEAARISGAEIVDVSSGVEYQPGQKNPKAIRAFLAACQEADLAQPMATMPKKNPTLQSSFAWAANQWQKLRGKEYVQEKNHDDVTQLIALLTSTIASMRTSGYSQAEFWAAWLEKALGHLQNDDASGITHLQKAYGGMSSINDWGHMTKEIEQLWRLSEKIRRDYHL